MELDRIKIFYAYNRWANSRVFNTVSNLDSGKYISDMRSSYPSIRDTMVHIISAEWIWLKRVQGISPKMLWTPSDFPTISELRLCWEEEVSKQDKLIRSLKEETLNVPVTYVNTQDETFTYPLWQILMHVVNHSSYHRGQVTTMLRQLGAEAVPLDFLVFNDMQNEIR